MTVNQGHSAKIQSQRARDGDALGHLLEGLDPKRLSLVREFVSQVIACHDPHVVEQFLKWRSDPTLESILQLASSMDDDAREQVLFTLEEQCSQREPEIALVRQGTPARPR